MIQSVFFPVPQVGKVKGTLKNFLIEPFVPHCQVLQIQFNLIFFDIFIGSFHIDSARGSLINFYLIYLFFFFLNISSDVYSYAVTSSKQDKMTFPHASCCHLNWRTAAICLTTLKSVKITFIIWILINKINYFIAEIQK